MTTDSLSPHSEKIKSAVSRKKKDTPAIRDELPLCFIVVRSPELEIALCNYLPANLQPIWRNGAISSTYVVRLPDHPGFNKFRLDAPNDGGELYAKAGAKIMQRWIFSNLDPKQLIAAAPLLSAEQCENLIALFNQGRL